MVRVNVVDAIVAVCTVCKMVVVVLWVKMDVELTDTVAGIVWYCVCVVSSVDTYKQKCIN